MIFIDRLKRLICSFEYRISCRNSDSFIAYCRKKGLKIGNGVKIPAPKTVSLDFSRPSLIEIGDNVRINKYMTIMSHDFASLVFLNKYNEFINSSGKIKIGNNVYFGHHCAVLKGVTIGDNCIIGFGSTVMHDIPANSVAVGTPAKVICSIDKYLEKRKQIALSEAFEYAQSIFERNNRLPVPEDFNEEFIYFVDSTNIEQFPMIPIRKQLGKSYSSWILNHKAMFSGFKEFLMAAGINTKDER